MINRERDFMMWVCGYIEDKKILTEQELERIKEFRLEVFRKIEEDLEKEKTK